MMTRRLDGSMYRIRHAAELKGSEATLTEVGSWRCKKLTLVRDRFHAQRATSMTILPAALPDSYLRRASAVSERAK